MRKLDKIRRNLKWKVISSYYKKLIKPNSKVIDVGAGDLYISKLIADISNSEVIGADINDYGTNLVKKVLYKDKLPFKDKFFDYATINEVLHHVDYNNQEKFLKDVKRVAKKVILLEDNSNSFVYFLEKFHVGRMPTPFAFRTTKGWMDFLKEIGFKITYVHIKRPFFYPVQYCLIIIEDHNNK